MERVNEPDAVTVVQVEPAEFEAVEAVVRALFGVTEIPPPPEEEPPPPDDELLPEEEPDDEPDEEDSEVVVNVLSPDVVVLPEPSVDWTS
jgi:hypothetical protein